MIIEVLAAMVSEPVVGWIMLGLAMAAAVYAYAKIRRNQRREHAEYRARTISLMGFPVATIPDDWTMERGRALCFDLRGVMVDCWNHFNLIYGVRLPATECPIHRLHLEHNPQRDGKYKSIWLRIPLGICHADVDHPQLARLWAAEVHNAYRMRNFGAQHIYQGDYMDAKKREQYRRACAVVSSFTVKT